MKKNMSGGIIISSYNMVLTHLGIIQFSKHYHSQQPKVEF
jgi:hypothetical protein